MWGFVMYICALLRPEPPEPRPELARLRWDRYRAYWRLTRIFREMRKELQRDPQLFEFFAFLQLPQSYNWRTPSPAQQEQMARWQRGLDDTRPRDVLFRRTKWLADRALARDAATEGWTWIDEVTPKS